MRAPAWGNAGRTVVLVARRIELGMEPPLDIAPEAGLAHAA
jgi:hypothetical protein